VIAPASTVTTCVAGCAVITDPKLAAFRRHGL
jgi:hypothetical protein